jgi:hypothetical protein
MNLATQTPCPRCGKPQAEWVEQDGKGYGYGAQVYCSRACALEDARPDSEVETPAPPVL